MASKNLRVIIFFGLLVNVFCEPCLKVESMKNLDLKKFFSSTWYELMRIPTEFEEPGICAAISHTVVWERIISATYNYNPSLTTQLVQGEILQGGNNLTFILMLFPSDSDNSTYHVLSTDYDNYALVQSCTEELGENAIERIWLLGRNGNILENDVASQIEDEIHKQGEDFRNKFETSVRSCSEPSVDCVDVKQMPGLNIAKVLTGDWYEMFRSENGLESNGENEICVDIKYTLEGKNVLVKHQVGDTVLFRATGDLTYNNVTTFSLKFPKEDESNYTIVKTDYDNYAVVYSCGAAKTRYPEKLWVLSRTGQLLEENYEDVMDQFNHLGGKEIKCSPPGSTSTPPPIDPPTTQTPENPSHAIITTTTTTTTTITTITITTTTPSGLTNTTSSTSTNTTSVTNTVLED